MLSSGASAAGGTYAAASVTQQQLGSLAASIDLVETVLSRGMFAELLAAGLFAPLLSLLSRDAYREKVTIPVRVLLRH